MLSEQKSFTGKPKQRLQQLMHRERRRSLDASTLSMPEGLPPLCHTILIVFWHIMSKVLSLYPSISLSLPPSGGRGSSAVERATPGEEVPGSIPAVAACSPLVGSVSV